MDSKYIPLDVNGTFFDLEREYLPKDSPLEAMFSGRHPLNLRGQRAFLDRDPKIFRYIVQFLKKETQNGKIEDENLILEEFDFWAITTENEEEL